MVPAANVTCGAFSSSLELEASGPGQGWLVVSLESALAVTTVAKHYRLPVVVIQVHVHGLSVCNAPCVSLCLDMQLACIHVHGWVVGWAWMWMCWYA